MRVNLDVRLVPALSKAVGKDRFDFDFEGNTVGDMVEALVTKFGARARRALYDSRNQFDGMIQVILNNQEWVRSDRLETQLEPDDQVALMLLIAGG
jgi:molybdopterin converting factor small subunit